MSDNIFYVIQSLVQLCIDFRWFSSRFMLKSDIRYYKCANKCYNKACEFVPSITKFINNI